MKVFVCGLAFDFERQQVLLLEKNRPSWQAGKLNGLGGAVVSGESPMQAMAREFKEETKGAYVGSLLYQPHGWTHFTTLSGDDWQCLFFVGFMNRADMLNAPLKNDVGEPLRIVQIDRLYRAKAIPNLRWLVPFALALGEYNRDRLPVVLHEATPGAIMRAAGTDVVFA